MFNKGRYCDRVLTFRGCRIVLVQLDYNIRNLFSILLKYIYCSGIAIKGGNAPKPCTDIYIIIHVVQNNTINRYLRGDSTQNSKLRVVCWFCLLGAGCTPAPAVQWSQGAPRDSREGVGGVERVSRDDFDRRIGQSKRSLDSFH